MDQIAARGAEKEKGRIYIVLTPERASQLLPFAFRHWG